MKGISPQDFARRRTGHLLALLLAAWSPALAPAGAAAGDQHSWHLSGQYLGLTYHPDDGTTPEVYPLKLDRRAYLVVDVGAAGSLDRRLGDHTFLRLTTTLYRDCAFVAAGALHFGPRLGFSRGRNALNAGIGPILSFRQDWHRFAGYMDDEFYGDRVYRGWQYRLFGTAVELEYLRRIGPNTELQWSVIPGVPLVVTLMVGLRWAL